MRVVTIEEHLVLPELAARMDPARVMEARGIFVGGDKTPPTVDKRDLLADVGADRLADMDRNGISMQVLSLVGPGAELLTGAEAATHARAQNDALAARVAAHPTRFAAFTHLPASEPEAAADELERTVTGHGFVGGFVHGTTNGLFLDDPGFAPLLARHEALDVPLYLHPAPPPKPVREAYYSGLPGHAGVLMSTAGWGWHSETAIHVLRMVLASTFDRHPKLKLIIGHMGEGLPAMFARCDQVFALEARDRLTRTVSQTITDQVWVTTSGFFSLAPLLPLLMTFGADRVIFSVDYPFSPNEKGRDFLATLPVSPADKIKLAHGNADALLKLKVA